MPLTTTHTRLTAPVSRPLSLALLISVLAALAIACTAMVATALWDSVRGTSGERHASLLQCAIVDSSSDRLACYDRIGADLTQ